jgi:hypothetical protein
VSDEERTRRTRRRQGFRAWAPWGLGLLLGALALGPGLGPGYILRYDMVFVPAPPISPRVLGIGEGFPRAVPSDAVLGVLGLALPGDAVQALVLLGIYALAAAGVWRLVPGPWPAGLAAAVFYVWNPFIAERLLLGQWALLLGYAGLPWVLVAASRLGGVRDLPRTVLALLPAAVGGFAAMVLSALVGLGVTAVRRPWRRAAASSGLFLAVVVVLSLPWLLPALRSAAVTDPAGVELFAARADTPFAVVGSLLSLGGIWNAQAVPPGFDATLPAAGRLLLSLAALAGFAWLMLRGSRPVWGHGLAAAAALGFAVALLGAFPTGRALLEMLIALWPGFGPLRDGQLYIAPLALLQAAGIAGVVQWMAAPAKAASPGDDQTPRRAGTLPTLSGLGLAALSVALLPGLLWGAGGRLTPVEYPEPWREVQRLLDEDPRPGAVLSLPWGAHRGIDWGPGEHRVTLDPLVKLVERPVLWNDGLTVEVDGEVRTVAGEDPAARRAEPAAEALAEALAAGGGAEGQAEALRDVGVAFVLVNRAAWPQGGGEDLKEPAGFRVLYDSEDLLLLEIP